MSWNGRDFGGVAVVTMNCKRCCHCRAGTQMTSAEAAQATRRWGVGPHFV